MFGFVEKPPYCMHVYIPNEQSSKPLRGLKGEIGRDWRPAARAHLNACSCSALHNGAAQDVCCGEHIPSVARSRHIKTLRLLHPASGEWPIIVTSVIRYLLGIKSSCSVAKVWAVFVQVVAFGRRRLEQGANHKHPEPTRCRSWQEMAELY